ncbi:MAG: hypothetical protein HN738_02405 [Gammaproteobacteria bacterium]|jgi:hypothetical protein|nr:hypothetical protein [Gammaproteobacteria bacterium]
MSGIRQPIRKIIIEVDGELDVPAPGGNFIGQAVSLAMSAPVVSGFKASMKRGEASEITVNIRCTTAAVTIVQSESGEEVI